MGDISVRVWRNKWSSFDCRSRVATRLLQIIYATRTTAIGRPNVSSTKDNERHDELQKWPSNCTRDEKSFEYALVDPVERRDGTELFVKFLTNTIVENGKFEKDGKVWRTKFGKSVWLVQGSRITLWFIRVRARGKIRKILYIQMINRIRT